MRAALVKNADRMMTSANPVDGGIELAFADGCGGPVPFADIPEIKGLVDLASIELPNAYHIVLGNSRGETIEFPWDFAHHYCDATYRPRGRGHRDCGEADAWQAFYTWMLSNRSGR